MHKESTPQEHTAHGLDHASTVAMPSPTLLAEAVSVDGFDAHSVAVAAFVAETRRLRISDVLAAVALDRHQPLVARERALGRLVVAYCRAVERTATSDSLPGSDCFTVAA